MLYLVSCTHSSRNFVQFFLRNGKIIGISRIIYYKYF